MRTRDKLDSYRVLAKALVLLKDRPWRALLVGDGPARAEVEALMAPLNEGGHERVRFAGALPREALPALYAGADLYLWPAINEAYGMTFLEAQAAGLPVVAGRTGGVARGRGRRRQRAADSIGRCTGLRRGGRPPARGSGRARTPGGGGQATDRRAP